jgi:putative transcriptional regulator
MNDKPDKPPSLTGKLLLAMPSMGDTRFQKAVIYLCAHDANGAMGLVINHKVPGIDLGQLLSQLNIAPAGKPGAEPDKIPVLSGGPVESARGFVLHSNDFQQADTIKIDDHVSVTGTIDALKAIAGGQGPENMLFLLGYAGWSPGQLDKEIQENAWLIAEADPRLVFDADSAQKWEKAVAAIGIDPAMLSGAAGHA